MVSRFVPVIEPMSGTLLLPSEQLNVSARPAPNRADPQWGSDLLERTGRWEGGGRRLPFLSREALPLTVRRLSRRIFREDFKNAGE